MRSSVIAFILHTHIAILPIFFTVYYQGELDIFAIDYVHKFLFIHRLLPNMKEL